MQSSNWGTKAKGNPGSLALTAMGISLASMAGPAFGQIVAANTPVPETVTVTGKAMLDLLPQSILDTPQSIDVVSQETLQTQNAATLEDALKNVPGITLNAGEGGAHGDTVNLRGFSASDDFFLDGLRDTGFYTRDSFDDESVEVYKGPSSTLFGRGSTGGVINQITKQPQLYPIEDFAVTGGTDDIRTTADVNTVLNSDSAMRVVIMGNDSGIAGQPLVRNRRFGVAPSYAAGLGEDTTFTLDFLHQQEDDIPDPGIPLVFGAPAPVDRATYYGLPANDVFKTDVNVLTARLSHDFTNAITVTDIARAGFYWFDARMTEPHFGSANCYPSGTAPFAGAPICTGAPGNVPATAENPLLPVAGQPLDTILVVRDRPSSEGTVQTLMNEADATMKFHALGFGNTLVAGLDIDQETANLQRFANQISQILPTPLLDPNPNESYPGTQTTITSRPSTTTDTVGVSLTDTIDFNPQWSVIAGGRLDDFAASYSEPVSASHFSHTDVIASPRAALVYKPDETDSFYFSYGTSFDPSAENLSLSSRTADLAPEKDFTLEAGGKLVWLDGLLATTAAVFNTEMTNARIADPLNPALQTLAGTERVNGFEFEVTGRITPQWEINAGYTYLDPYSNGLVAAGVPGTIPNTAHDEANLWTVYDFDSGMQLGTGVNYVGQRPGDPGGTEYVPGYVTWDAMISYPLTDKVSLQLNAYNLLDAYYFANVYYSSAAENHVIPGAGRTLLLTARVSL